MTNNNKNKENSANQHVDNQKQDVKEKRYEAIRSDTRFYVPIIVTVNGTDYVVSDWSAGGFKLNHFDRNFQVNDCLPIHLSFNFQGGLQISLDLQAEIVWRSSKTRTTGFRFLNIRASEKELIRQIGNDIRNNKLTPEEPTINSEKLANQQVAQQAPIPEETLIPEKKKQNVKQTILADNRWFIPAWFGDFIGNWRCFVSRDRVYAYRLGSDRALL